MTGMLVAQRQELLVQELQASGIVRIPELATRFGVSAGTIRRDLADLALAGRVTRIRGGAMLTSPAHHTARQDGAPPAPSSPAPRPAAAERTVGLLVPSATYYYPQVVAGVRAVAAQRRARIVVGLTDYAQPRDLRQIDELYASGADGLLVTPADGHYVPEETMARLRAGGRPFVLLERQPRDAYEPCEFVATDHRQGGYAAVRHLAGLGHRRVGLFTTGSPTAALVGEGHAQAAEQLGLDPDAPVTRLGRPAALGSAEAAHAYDAFIESCRATGTKAALVHSDHDAIELLRRLRAKGLRTPDDLALIAYDDEIAALAEVPLTAVAPPKQEIGDYAIRLLLDRLDAAGEPPSLRQIAVQPRLIVRESCGAARPA